MKQTDFRDIPDDFWEGVAPLLGAFKRRRSGESRPVPQRTILTGTLYKFQSGCQWSMLPASYGAKSTVHEHFQRWVRAGILETIFRILLEEYGEKVGFATRWQGHGRLIAASPDALSKNQWLKDWKKPHRQRKKRQQTSSACEWQRDTVGNCDCRHQCA